MRGHRHAPAVAGELDRVRQEVEHDLLELALVADIVAQGLVDSHLELYAVALRALAHQGDGVVERGGQIEGSHLQLHAPGLDLGQVEDVVDERQEMLAGGVDVLGVIELFFVELAEHTFDEHLGKADHGIQRGAQFMRHVGQEVRLVLVGQLQLAAFFLDFLEQAGVGDGDRGLVGEGAHQRDLVVGKATGFGAAHRNDP